MSLEKKTTIAKGLVAQLRATEAAIDTALTETAQYIEAAIAARSAANVSSTVGGDVLNAAIDTMAKLQSAQDALSTSHAALAVVGKNMGIGTTNFLPVVDKPEDDKKTTGAADGTGPAMVIPLGDKPDREDEPTGERATTEA
jgi:hypothetical protein